MFRKRLFTEHGKSVYDRCRNAKRGQRSWCDTGKGTRVALYLREPSGDMVARFALGRDRTPFEPGPLSVQVMSEVVRKGRAILFSSHILSEVTAISERILIIQLGHLLADTPLAYLKARAKAARHA